MSDAGWGTIGLIVVSIVSQIYTAWRAERSRKWDVEDRRNDALMLAQKTEAEAREVKRQLEESHQEIKVKIDDNTQKSVEAFAEANMAIKVANSMNEKLLRLTQAIQSVQPAVVGRRRSDE